MAKADRIQHKMVAVLCDGVQLHRVQRVGVSADLPQDATGELSNSGVVEYIKGTPDITITLETNEVGSNDNLALLADKMINKSVLTNFGTSLPRAGLGGWAIRAASSNTFGHSVNAQDLVAAYCDFMIPITEDNVNVSRTMWIHYAALTNVSWSFDVNGYASENYQFKAGNKRWFLNDFKNARVYKLYPGQAYSGTGNMATAGVLFRLGSAFPAVPPLSRVLYYCQNDKIYSFASTAPIDGSFKGGATAASRFGNATLAGGFLSFATTVAGAVSSAAQLRSALSDNLYVVYRANPGVYGLTWNDTTKYPASTTVLVDSSPGYALNSLSTAHGGTGRAYIKAWLYNKTGLSGYGTLTDANKALRLQTVNIDIALSSDQLLQLGQLRPYGVTRAVPVPVNVSVTAKDSDLQLFCAAGSTAYSNTTVKTFSVEDFNGTNSLQIEVYKDAAKTTKLRTFRIDRMAVTSDNSDIAYAGDGTYEINFTADNIVSVGAGVNVTGY